VHLEKSGCAAVFYCLFSSPGRKAEGHMTEEAPAVEQEAQTPTTEQAQPDATGEKAERVFKQSEVEALVRDRLASAQRKADEAAKKAAADAEAKALKEQGEYKTLYEKLQAELEQERTRAKQLEVAGMRRDVAARLNLPAGLVDRLRGETDEEITADAETLLAALPKPAAPDINAGNSSMKGGGSLPYGMTEESIKEQAVRLGVDPKLYRQQFIRS
jgi:hypothetical protein